MAVKPNEYTMLEYLDDNDEFSVIGRIIMDGAKFVSAEVTCDIIMDADELAQVRAFLDVVEKKIVEATQ
jgi:hypothetical protein